MARLIAPLGAFVMAWLGILGPSVAAAPPSTPSAAAHAYDSHQLAWVGGQAVTERGPPASYSDVTTYDADSRLSSGSSARPNASTIPATYDYDDVARLVQTARGSHGIREQVDSTDRRSVFVQRSDAAANSVSRLVPGGGLAAHEAAGGHALARHVGRTDADLLARLSAQPGIAGASSFSSRAVAESSVAGLLDANASGISSWLAGSGGKLVLNGSGGITGRYVAQGSASISNVSGVRAVLVRDANMSIGYRIQTAFPTP